MSLLLLGACNNPIIIPADMAVTLPANQDFILHATQPVNPGAEPGLTTSLASPSPNPTKQPTETATVTPTVTPKPTRKPDFPIEPGSALMDPGFQAIDIENSTRLTTIYKTIKTNRRHTTISADGLKLFMSTSNGTYLFNRQGEALAYWENIFTPDMECESCISSNKDGSRVAVITRNAGVWEVQMYDVVSSQVPLLVLSIPIQTQYKGSRNEASVAISPDDKYMAFQFGNSEVRVLDLETKLQVFTYQHPISGIRFSPDGTQFVIHTRQELLLYQVSDWQTSLNVLLPREDCPFAFSPNGSRLVIALPTLLRIYDNNARLKLIREIIIPPSNANARQWQIAFSDAETLTGYSIRWEDSHKLNAIIERGQWNIESGNTLHFELSNTSTPDALPVLWGSQINLPVTIEEFGTDSHGFNAFRFISNSILLVNNQHAACWLNLLTGENTCYKDSDHNMFASDTNIFNEIRENTFTNLNEFRSGVPNIQVGPYQIAAINRNGEWAFINNGKGTDLYTKGKNLPQESVSGTLQGYAENTTRLVFTTREHENTFTITVVNKTSGDAIVQKKDNFLFKPVLMDTDGTVYYTQNDPNNNQTTLHRIDPITFEISEVTSLGLTADLNVLSSSSTNLFAAGMQDGSILLLTKDGTQKTILQAANSSITGLSFSPDGHFLAIASSDGVKIFSVVPGKN